MTNRLLEIGAGGSPAIQNPGWLIDTQKPEYFAIDAGGVSRIVTWDKVLIGTPNHETFSTATLGTVERLPFRAESFGRVIMKSVIGEYSLHQLKGYSPHEPGYSGQSFTSTMQGFQDVLRVLEPNGEVVISEEDTPANCLQLAAHLSDTGFKDINITPYCPRLFNVGFGNYNLYNPGFISRRDMYGSPQFINASDDWLHLRGAYWSLTNMTGKYGDVVHTGNVNDVAERYYSYAYVMTALKPL